MDGNSRDSGDGNQATGNEEGWTEVKRRCPRRNKGESEKGWANFFFRNFPENCTEETLRQNFEKIGKVEDIFIPGKRDKLGNRFGFVRFQRADGEDRILESLNQVWIGSYIIRAYIPKFERNVEGRGSVQT